MERFIKPTILGFALCASAFSAQALTLNEALLVVQQENPLILQAKESVNARSAALTQARSEFIPDIAVSGSYTSTTLDREGTDSETHPRALGITARQTLFNGGNIMYGYRAAKMGLKAAEATYENTRQSTLLSAVDAYVGLLTAKDVQKLQANQVNLLKEQLSATNAQFEAGEVTKTDLSQAKARLASTEANYVQAKGSVHVAQATLDKLIGHNIEALTWPKAGVEVPEDLANSLETALNTHPRILSSLSALAQTRYQKIQAQSAYFPKVDAVASHSHVDNDDTKGYRDNRVGVELSWSLFNGGNTKGSVDAAAAAKVSAEEAYEEARREIKEAVTQAFYNYQTALSVLTARKAEEKAAMLAERGVRNENQLGERTVLDLLDARQELLTARVNKTRAKGDVISSSYALLAAIGTLTVDTPEEESAK